MNKSNWTPEQWEEEIKKCQDPRYYYNNYWTVDNKPVKPLSKKEWNTRTCNYFRKPDEIDNGGLHQKRN